MTEIIYEPFNHVNTSDAPEKFLSIQGTTEEPKIIKKICIESETNDGLLVINLEREQIGSKYTNNASISNTLDMIIDRDLKDNLEFFLTLQNSSAGVNAEITGYIEYEISD